MDSIEWGSQKAFQALEFSGKVYHVFIRLIPWNALKRSSQCFGFIIMIGRSSDINWSMTIVFIDSYPLSPTDSSIRYHRLMCVSVIQLLCLRMAKHTKWNACRFWENRCVYRCSIRSMRLFSDRVEIRDRVLTPVRYPLSPTDVCIRDPSWPSKLLCLRIVTSILGSFTKSPSPKIPLCLPLLGISLYVPWSCFQIVLKFKIVFQNRIFKSYFKIVYQIVFQNFQDRIFKYFQIVF